MANSLESNPADYGKLLDGYNTKEGSGPIFDKKTVGGRTYKVLKNEDTHQKSSLSKLVSSVKRKCSKSISWTFSKSPPKPEQI